MRRLFVVATVGLLLLGALVVAADRGGAWLSARLIADQVQAGEHLTQRPEVRVAGTPFLPQLIRGRYQAFDVRARDLRSGPLPLADVDATVSGVRLPLADIVSGSVSRVAADQVRARVLVRYADLDPLLADRNLKVSPAGDALRVTGTARVLGRDLAASALSDVAVRDGQLVVTARKIETGNGLADSALSALASGRRFDFTVPAADLPFGLRLDGVRVQPDGLALTAQGHAVELSPG
jgi:LmeA-like phospholipid-binding